MSLKGIFQNAPTLLTSLEELSHLRYNKNILAELGVAPIKITTTIVTIQ
jgi:hypothetical protein